jgi:phosphoribosylformylglycinamidine cyclo-ligase
VSVKVAEQNDQDQNSQDRKIITYKDAGVDIEAGNEAVRQMKEHVRKTFRPEVLTDLGGFGGLFALDVKKYRKPVLVSGTDGVGTKLKIAMLMDRHDTIGIDAVAMCVNDILVQGAEPLFFLDYLAVGKLKPEQVATIVQGIAAGCLQAGCALIGGETAEMPGFYGEDEYDVAGFVVGVVERSKIIDGSAIQPGDILIGLPSSGLHSNGYSLARKVLLEAGRLELHQHLEELGQSLGEELLTPTRIYVQQVKPLLETGLIKGMAHITGGGLLENIPRVLPPGAAVELNLNSWPVPPVFELIRRIGNVPEAEMYRTFNMGVGLVLVVPAAHQEELMTALANQGERAYIIGAVIAGEGQVELRRADRD